jgi:hypothetical protein
VRRTILRAALGACALAGLFPAQAAAIQGGTIAGPGEFTNVAVLRFIDVDGATRWRCSGTLVAPNVIITAAHCTEGAELVYYSFAAQRPTVEPDAPNATGWTLGGSNLDAEQNIFTDPDWNGDLQNQSLDDIGVVILDAPENDIPVATIAPEVDMLEGLPRGTLFTLAGYGVNYVKPAEPPRKPTVVAGLFRSWTTSPLANLTSDTIILQSNPNDSRGGGGICSGDSGGPVFLEENVIVGVTSWGSSQFCTAGATGFQRLDTEDAREFYEPLLALAAERLG